MIDHGEYRSIMKGDVLYKSDYPIPDMLYSFVASAIISIALAWSLTPKGSLIISILIAVPLGVSFIVFAMYYFGRRIIIKREGVKFSYMIFSDSRNIEIEYQQIIQITYNGSVYASKPILSVHYTDINNKERVFRCEIYWDLDKLKELMYNKNVKFVEA